MTVMDCLVDTASRIGTYTSPLQDVVVGEFRIMGYYAGTEISNNSKRVECSHVI